MWTNCQVEKYDSTSHDKYGLKSVKWDPGQGTIVAQCGEIKLGLSDFGFFTRYEETPSS